MSEQDHQVYSWPDQPGAPQVGDVVVVVSPSLGTAWPPDPGCIGVLRSTDRQATPGPARWYVRYSGPYGGGWAKVIRRPTPGELAAYRLTQGAP